MRAGIVLVLGGARSGKSAHAERLAVNSGLDRVYIATGEAGDAEMRERIEAHRARRANGWRTVEEPDRLEYSVLAEAKEGRAVVVDCLTLWLSNLMQQGADPEVRTQGLCDALARVAGLVIVISNEIGLGIVPDNPLGRRFRDAQGRLNQAVAGIASRVDFIAAGLPLILKERPQ